MSLAVRLTWLVTGLACAVSSLIQLAGPRYWDATTTLDYLAVYSYTAAWLSLAASVLLLGRVVGRRDVIVVSAVVAIAAVATGVANLIEDGLGIKTWGTVYVIGALATWLGLLPLAFLVWRDGPRGLSVAPALTFIGFAFVSVGGGVIVLVGWAWPALRPKRFLAVAGAPSAGSA
jgi:hypothetical protein